MPCSVFDAFPRATEYLSEEIHKLAYFRSLPINIIPRKPFPQNVGTTMTGFILGPVYPGSAQEGWRCLPDGSCPSGTVEGGSGLCKQCWADTEVGYFKYTYAPERFSLRGPILCIDEHLFSHMPDSFVSAYVRALAKRMQISLENRHLNAYMHLTHKWVAAAAFAKKQTGGSLTDGCVPQNPSMTDVTIPTSRLTQQMLDYVAMDLIEQGAPDYDTEGWVTAGDAGPVFPLLIGAEASNSIQTSDSSLRADFNWSYAGRGEENPVLKRIAAPRIIKNFKHIITLTPPRWYYYHGQGFVRMPSHTMVSGTKGKVARINPMWQAAPYEGAIVLMPQVMTERVFPPKSRVGDVTWSPQNYMGEWRWVEGGKEVCSGATGEEELYDPTKKLGRHFAEYIHAYEPVFPQHGALILFKRCPTTSFDTITCVS